MAKETTTEALARMMREQAEKREEVTKTEEGSVTIDHPGNRGVIIGRLNGDMNF